MEYLSIKQTAEKWGITVRRIQVLCAEDRIPGAIKIGSYWAVPADAEKPCDQRIKSGKYMKECPERDGPLGRTEQRQGRSSEGRWREEAGDTEILQSSLIWKRNNERPADRDG